MKSMKKPDLYAHGGMVADPNPHMGEEKDLDQLEGHGIADAIRRQFMARGGLVGLDHDDYDMDMMHQENDPDVYSKEGLINYASGGMVGDMFESDEDMETMSSGSDLTNAIHRKYMDKGGVADPEDTIDDNAIEHKNYLDKLNYDLADNEMYSEQSALDDVSDADMANRGSIGPDDKDSDQYDMVSAIRKKYAKR